MPESKAGLLRAYLSADLENCDMNWNYSPALEGTEAVRAKLLCTSQFPLYIS